MRWLLLLGALGGCDAVFGLDDAALPKCVVGDGFESASITTLQGQYDVYSLDGAREHGVASVNGVTVETVGAEAEIGDEIDIQPMYAMLSVAVEPNNDYFFLTASIEPPRILAVTKDGDAHKFDPRVPKGFIAGTPTNRMNGKPVRVIVRLYVFQEVFQEYERDLEGNWNPVGERFELKAIAGANMTQDGLAIVFDGYHRDDMRGVYIAQRGSIDDAFETPQLVLAGTHVQPQLFGSCNTLYSLDEDFTLTRRFR